jgi:hypothetical protein
LFATGSITFDLVSVSGLHRTPSPAARITAFINDYLLVSGLNMLHVFWWLFNFSWVAFGYGEED